MSACTLQPATRTEDHERLAALARRIWHEHYPGIITVGQIEYMLAHGYDLDTLAAEQAAGTRFVLACREQNALAFAAVSPDAQDGDTAWLDKLYVLDTARGQGIARRLIEWALETAADLNATTLRLRVNRTNDSAVAVYRRFGFEVEKTHVKPIGNGFVMDDYIMQRPVEPH
ncbi:GNAT family N-acetyltransferase [Endozoicomonas sp. G2_2]|uniref:GNAT family N-acetyltransferase n=1 Tax=Endozoicomonas sp. G2_2 TaxID=2821092 RepID=UPI001ADBDADF|nr:GNAT family N-acetyltransferase [Endozoicomonas sp. G2_2]MBO9469987.1 GNAT family N-acetyltransferase [Endozoicomonas sp. G2_2]